MSEITIVGMGLAGSCLAWQLWRRGVAFRIIDNNEIGSSHVAAGLVQAVTGKNCTVSWRYKEFVAEAEPFYREIETILHDQFWFPLEVLRLIFPHEEKRMIGKLFSGESLAWVKGERHDHAWPTAKAYILHGAARMDVPKFIRATRAFFDSHGLIDSTDHAIAKTSDITVWCGGAAGLLRQQPIVWRQRCAKGEILTIRAHGWQQTRLVVGRGWMVPIGDDCYKVGATYDWDSVATGTTKEARTYLEKLATELAAGDYEVIAHEAGIRPIVRKSQPVIGPLPDDPRQVVFNGLGSKGSLCAPTVSRQLAEWLISGAMIDEDLSSLDYFAKLSNP